MKRIVCDNHPQADAVLSYHVSAGGLWHGEKTAGEIRRLDLCEPCSIQFQVALGVFEPDDARVLLASKAITKEYGIDVPAMCQVCDKAFQRKRRDTIYCSASCRQFVYRTRKKARLNAMTEDEFNAHLDVAVAATDDSA